jgi:arylsulfatase A-like enzyme
VKAGTTSSTPVCHTDFMATAAAITETKLPDTAAEDSFSLLPELLGSGRSARPSVVHHSIHGQFAIREASWKLAFCPGSGGWGKPGDGEARTRGLPSTQLYDLATDPMEEKNVVAAHPEVAARLTATMEAIITRGRSSPGAAQQNDTVVDYHIARPKARR